MKPFFTKNDCDGRLFGTGTNGTMWNGESGISLDKANALLRERGKVVHGDEENGWVYKKDWDEDWSHAAVLICIEKVEADSAEKVLRDFMAYWKDEESCTGEQLYERAKKLLGEE